MNIVVLLFFVVIMLYIIFVDIFTVLFRLTGLSEEKARFQVISLLTNSGFTTDESEMVVSAKIRRKLAKIIMLFGYAFTATIVSSIVSVFVSFNSLQAVYSYYTLVIVAGIFIVFIIIRRITTVQNFFDTLIEKFYLRFILHEKINPIIIIEDYKTRVIANVFISEEPELLKGKTLSDVNIKNIYHILVLMIKRADGTIVFADANTVIKKSDHVILMGNKNDINTVFSITSNKKHK